MGKYDRKRRGDKTEKKGGVILDRFTKLGIWSNANPRGHQLNKINCAHNKIIGMQLTLK